MQENKLNWKFFVHLFKEAIGFDSGYIRTTIDIIKKPNIVLEKYKAGDLKYVNPVRYLLSSSTYFILTNSFLVDWEKVGIRHTQQLRELSKNDTDFSHMVGFGELLFSKFLVPMILLSAIVKLFYIQKFSKNKEVLISDHIAIVFYSAGISTIFSLWASVMIMSMHILVFLTVIFLTTIFYLAGYRKLFEPKSVKDFLPEQGGQYQKVYKNGDLIVMIIILILSFTFNYIQNPF
jgi:hypothetical protein